MRQRRQIKADDLRAPEDFLPEWFAVSASMVSCINSCEYEAFYKYVLRVKPKQNNLALIRGSIVHTIMQNMLNKGIPLTDEEIHDYVITFLQQEVKAIRTEYKLDNDIDPWDVLREVYKIPTKKPTKADVEAGIEKPDAFNLDQFIKQCESAAKILQNFVKERGLVAITNPVTKRKMIEMDIKHPMVTSQGELLDTTHDKPTMIRSIIDLVAIDPTTGMLTIFDWKTGLKKSSTGQDISPIDSNQAVIAYVKAMLHEMPRDKWPNKMKDTRVNTALVRAVVKNNGEKSLDEPEWFEKLVTVEEIDEVVESFSRAAKRLKSLDLRREVTFNCARCPYARLCLKKDYEDYFVYEYTDDLLDSEDDE